MFKARSGIVWLGMLLAGLALGAYVLTAWPDTSTHLVRLPYGEALPKTPTVDSRQVRRTASVRSASTQPESELSGAPGVFYPVELDFYAVSPAPLLDALISAPLAADAS